MTCGVQRLCVLPYCETAGAAAAGACANAVAEAEREITRRTKVRAEEGQTLSAVTFWSFHLLSFGCILVKIRTPSLPLEIASRK